jgi:hypothetical protein
MNWRKDAGACAVVALTATALANCTDLNLDFYRSSDAGGGGGMSFPDAAGSPEMPADASADAMNAEAAVLEASGDEAPPDASDDSSSESSVEDAPSDVSPDGNLTPCQGDQDCSGNTPHCNQQTHFCFTCAVDMDCGIGMKCNTNIPKCARKCTAGSDCPTNVCDVAAGYCVDCMINTDCAGGQTCIRPQGLCTSQ